MLLDIPIDYRLTSGVAIALIALRIVPMRFSATWSSALTPQFLFVLWAFESEVNLLFTPGWTKGVAEVTSLYSVVALAAVVVVVLFLGMPTLATNPAHCSKSLQIMGTVAVVSAPLIDMTLVILRLR